MGLFEKAIKSIQGNSCATCGVSGDEVPLHKAHVPAKSRGGSGTILLCPNCHAQHDHGVLPRRKQQKLGYSTPKSYRASLPKKRKPGGKTTTKKPVVKKPVKRKARRKSANDIWW